MQLSVFKYKRDIYREYFFPLKLRDNLKKGHKKDWFRDIPILKGDFIRVLIFVEYFNCKYTFFYKRDDNRALDYRKNPKMIHF